MMRHRRVLLLVVGIAVFSPQICAAYAPLDAIPDNALAVIRVRKPRDTVKKVIQVVGRLDKSDQEQLKKMFPTVEELISDPAETIGTLISNPSLSGVDPKGDWWFAIFVHETRGPSIVFGIPARDMGKLRQSIVGKYNFMEKEKYLFFTEGHFSAEAIRAMIDGNGTSIAKSIDRPSKALMSRSDISLFLNVTQLKKDYSKELLAIREEKDKAFEEWKTFAPEVPGMDMEPVFQMYGEAADMLLQAVRDTKSFTIGVSLNTRGLSILEHIGLEADSKTAKLLSAQTTSDMSDLALMPADKPAYGALHGDFSALNEWWVTFSAAMIQDEEDRKAMQEAAAEQAKIKYTGLFMTFDLGDLEDGLFRFASVTLADPINKVRELMRKTAGQLAGMNFGGATQNFEIEVDAEQYGSHSADLLTTNVEFDENLAPIEIQKQMMDMMFGPDGLSQRIVYLGDRLVQTMGGGKSTMEEVLKAQEAGPPATKSKATPFSQTRKLLDEKANLLFLVDLPGLVATAAKLVVSSGSIPIPLDAEAIEGLELERSYSGFSLAVGPADVSMKTHIPLSQMEGFMKLAAIVQKMIPQQPGF